MSGLRPPFDLAEIELSGTSDELIRFPDRYRDGVAAPARFEGSQLSLVRVTPAAGHSDFALRWPADGCTKTVDLLPADATTLGVSRLLEISLLPFALAEVLRSMRGGVPTFYFGYAASPYPADDALVRTSDAPILFDTALFGVMFQDRATLAPRGWFDRIAEALQTTRAADAALWRTWSQRYAVQPVLRLLDPQGRPLAGQSLILAISDSSGTVLSTQTRTSDNKGDVAGLAFPTAGQHGALSWQPNPVPAETPLPVMALLETPAETVPGQNLLTLQPGFTGGHLQLLDLANWYARGLHDDPWGPAPGARYRLNSLMQPIVDGIPAFSAILEDLNRAKGTGGDALFAGWAFTDFAMRLGDETTSLFRIGGDVAAAGGDVRILVAQFLQASDASLNTLSREIGLVYLILLGVGNPAALITTAASSYTSPLGLAAFAVLAGAAMALYLSKLENGEAVGDTLRKVTEQTDPDFFTKLSTLKGPRFDVRRSPHPVTIADNPVSASIPLPDGRTLGDLQDRWGVFHQKIQVVRHADSMAASDQDRHVAYVGGIDINENRLDTPGHQGAAFRKPDSVADPTASPFHDVHSRITGPAASEVFAVFAGRYVRDTEGDSTAPPPPVVPTPSALNGTGRDVMQVAQTSFKPKPGSGSVGFDWAPEGNATTYGTIVNAIRAAREFIYIEEQYMVPDKGYIQALVDAAANCQRLVILLPSFLEIFFGDRRRGEMFDEMAAVWGDRMLIGTPMRRPVLAPTGRVASVGRFALVADIDPLASTLFVEPPTRVPKGAFFMWIGGELMYATDSTAVNGPGGKPAMQLTVLRGGLGTAQRWCPNPRAHRAGEPITLAQPGPIFVHSKIMMVDDLFVAIGSTNVNRRGFFHDGEIHAFAIPQDLKAASDNPARDLRTRLWAEQLGIMPAMGAALLADPIAGFELFRRSHYQGNRFVPLSELKVPTPTLASLPELFEIIPTWARQLLQFTVQNVLELKSDDIFNTLSDPTTGIDPAPEPGPGLN